MLRGTSVTRRLPIAALSVVLGACASSSSEELGADAAETDGARPRPDGGSGGSSTGGGSDGSSPDRGGPDAVRDDAASSDATTDGGAVEDGATIDAGSMTPEGGGDGGSGDGAPDEGGLDPADGTAADGAAPDARDGGTVVPGFALTKLTANQSGRTGADLLIGITGTDPAQTAFAAHLELFDSSGSPVLAFSDTSGAKSNQRTLLFDQQSAAGLTSFSRTVTLPGYAAAFPAIARVSAHLVDALGPSSSLSTSVVAQKLLVQGDRCDGALVINRCPPAFACSGAPATCARAPAPQIARFAYLEDPKGPRILLLGSDPADDISNIHLEFLNDSGAPVSIDVTGSGDFKTAIDLAVPQTASQLGSFFTSLQAAPAFNTKVPKLAATPQGQSTGAGSRTLATLSPVPRSPAGSPCDLRGFSECLDGNACVPSSDPDAASPSYLCRPTPDAMNAAAAAAPLLDPDNPSRATGYTTPVHLFGAPPPGCLPPGVESFPQAVVRLHLARDTPLTVTAGNPETNFPNAIFILQGVGAAASFPPLACNGASPSVLSLSNLPQGDYSLVVHSRSPSGGQFALSFK